MPENEAKHPESGDHRAVRLERNAVHGHPLPGHRALGMTWAGILSDWLGVPVPPLPCHVVCLLLVGLKLNRAARPLKYSEDDYDDARNYLDFAQESDPQNVDADIRTDPGFAALLAETKAALVARNEIVALRAPKGKIEEDSEDEKA